MGSHKKLDFSELVKVERWDLIVDSFKASPLSDLSDQERRLLGLALYKCGNYLKSRTVFEALIAKRPDDLSLQINVGLCYFGDEDFQRAMLVFQTVLERDPSHFTAHLNYALSLERLGRLSDAEQAYQGLIKKGIQEAELFFNLGNLYFRQDSYSQALEAYKVGAELQPKNANIAYSLGNAYSVLRQTTDAISNYEKCLQLNPAHLPAMQSLGALFLEVGDPKAAREVLKRAILIDQSSAQIHNNLGLAYQRTQNFAKALRHFRLALQVDSTFRPVWSQLQNLRTLICDETVFTDEEVVSGDIWGGAAPFTFFVLEDNPERQLLRSEDFANVHLKPHVPKDMPLCSPPPDNRLVLGFFSADFKGHATTYLISGLLRNLDRSKFKVILFNYSLGSDKATESLKLIADEFIEVAHYSDRAIAELSRQKGVQIAFDLKGYTENSRPKIFAFRAAPVQINYLGYPGTLGAPWIDYLIADQFVIPPDCQAFYSENILYLPNCYQPTDDERMVSDVTPSRSDCGLPENCVVFCSFNQNYKITPREVEVWSRILLEIPDSVLWLFRSNNWSVLNLTRQFKDHGIVKDRLIFAPQIPQEEHMARYRHADIFLDTFNVNAHTTASDALWMGVPVVTRPGKQFAARVAGSILTALGVPELIVNSDDEYVEKVIRLATDSAYFSQIKNIINSGRENSAMFSTSQYAEDFQQLCSTLASQVLA